LYEIQTQVATLSVTSFDQHLSDDAILDMLIKVDGIYWGFLDGDHQTWCGYFGLHYPPDSPIELSVDKPHTQISITWPKHAKKVHLLKRLRTLAKAGGEQLPFWAELAGAIAAADHAFCEGRAPKSTGKVTGVPNIFASMNARPGVPEPQEPGIETIEAFARHLAAPWAFEKPAAVASEFDTCGKAFLWRELGKALWSPECLRGGIYFANNPVEEIITSALYPTVADHWLNLVNFGQLETEISGVKLKYDHNGDNGVVVGLWQQSVELETSRIPAQALRYLHRRQIYSPNRTAHPIINGYDAAYGDALSEKLIAEAAQKSSFVPVGGFRMTLPPGTPVLGVEELCIWTDGKGIWVLPIPDGLIFYWRPGQTNPLSQIDGINNARSAWNLVLSALWYDLVTEGPKVIVRTSNDQPVLSTNPTEGKKHRRRGRSRPDTHVLRLPSQRVIHMDGVHTWGTPEEIEKIKRQAHQVRGHRCKLLPGHQRSLYALENARRFNFIMPDGYTFVKPYQTGLNDPDAPATKETPILARGLASLMLMSKDYSKRSAAS